VNTQDATQASQDIALLQRFQQGEQSALSALYQRYDRPLTEFLVRMLGDREAAQDLKQDVFVKVLLHAKSFRGSAKVSTWLFAIAKNCCLSYLRHQKVVDRRIQREPSDEQDGAWLERVPSAQASQEDKLNVQQEFAKISVIIRTLSKEQQQVLLLREGLDYAHNEIAQELGCPENTVKTRTFRALGHIRKALGVEKMAA
jgi:RNA polymerase sigma-70 factor (ECF subfamily)